MGFEQYLSILKAAKAEAELQASLQPQACPNDGTPLREGPNGELYCIFDGWKWQG